ncbi:GntR family transcriptional regulator [Microbacterium enclense]|uniref:GntR family transcriptional regulator n=1 Tax=Microbacterium enclense TaxID=993073 RepID=A0A3S3LAD2_9MICO|nr:GntR family transcriptional regulator [Microbacterium enclense]RWR15664.1 GntR family transcriptional regulator [Microbacterium enclense]
MGDQIAHRLRVEIIRGVIPPGTHLAEDSLAARFDVSRGPVRDALRQLEVEGLAEDRRKRLYARAMDLRDVEELYVVREALESLAIRLAIQHASASDWDRVQRIVDGMSAAADDDDGERFAELDMEFHTSFYTNSQNRRLVDAWRPYQRIFAILFELSDTSDIASATADHQGFLDIIRTGDVDAAVHRLRLHLTLAKGHVRDVLRGLEAGTVA